MSGNSEIPEWVPPAVTLVAPRIPKAAVAERLLTDERMKLVWRELLRVKLARGAARRFEEIERLKFWDLSERGVSANERACAAFFICVASKISSRSPRLVWTRIGATKQAARWAAAGDLCRYVMHEPMFGRQRDAASKMAVFFEENAKSLREKGYFANLDQRQLPFILDRSSRSRGDDNVRGQTRGFSADVHRIFGSWLDGTVATVATVALELPQKIRRKSVENWRKGPPITQAS